MLRLVVFAALNLVLSLSGLVASMPTDTSPDESSDYTSTDSHHGRGTYYYVGLGACGAEDNDSEHIVALSITEYDSGKRCNSEVEIHVNGKTAYGTVRDRCPRCGSNDLDLSPSLFEKFASLDVGVIDIKWNFV